MCIEFECAKSMFEYVQSRFECVSIKKLEKFKKLHLE